jgi:hypothetical protein
MRTFLLSLAASLTLSSAVASVHKPDPSALVFLRVEGADKTIFEGPVRQFAFAASALRELMGIFSSRSRPEGIALQPPLVAHTIAMV